jgi:hypothetical protein
LTAAGFKDHFSTASERIRQARPHTQVDHRIAPAEASGLAEDSVDLVTVTQAAHWFDLPPTKAHR